MNTIEIYILIVIYNKKCLNSVTCLCLKNIDNVNVILVDNSTQDYQNKFFASKNKWIYISMNGNMGLSKAYNKGISVIKDPNAIVCLFDDDTIVSSDYFDTLREFTKQHEYINIFAPIVEDVKGIISPCILDGMQGKRIQKITDIPKNKISAINSGLAVRLKVFKHYKYDENLFLDYVDHSFIKDIIQNDETMLCVLPTIIKQSFSNTQKLGIRTDLQRFKSFKKEISYFCKKYEISMWNKMFFLQKRRLEIFSKYIKS